MRKFLRNQKGTAEVIGTIMFIMILLFFFTNVYLWHDTAAKQMDNMYVQKMNTPITISFDGTSQLTVTDKGGQDASLTMLWIDSGTGPGQIHTGFSLNKVVPAGSLIALPVPILLPAPNETMFTVVTTLGNSASYDYITTS